MAKSVICSCAIFFGVPFSGFLFQLRRGCLWERMQLTCAVSKFRCSPSPWSTAPPRITHSSSTGRFQMPFAPLCSFCLTQSMSFEWTPPGWVIPGRNCRNTRQQYFKPQSVQEVRLTTKHLCPPEHKHTRHIHAPKHTRTSTNSHSTSFSFRHHSENCSLKMLS